MKQRVITAVIAFIILIPFLIFSNTPAFVFLACLLTVISAFELLGCVGLRRNVFASVPTYLLAVAIPLSARLDLFGLNRFDGNNDFIAIMFLLDFIYIMTLFTVAVFSKGAVKFGDAAVLTIMMIYVTFGFSALVKLRAWPYHGTFLFLLALIMPWISDTFAYFSGRFFGKHKLIPDVSPKKTVEGAIGAIILSGVAAFIYGIVCNKRFSLQVNYAAMAVVGVLISLTAQCGDLIASMVKRSYGIKDYGKLLPGHGGILDRFDSTIATTSVVYIFFMLFPFTMSI